MLVEAIDDLGKVDERTREPIDLVHNDDIDLAHMLKCPSGWWVRRRHTEVLKTWVRMMRGVSETVVEEPILGPVIGGPFLKVTTTVLTDARADILARGFFTYRKKGLIWRGRAYGRTGE